MAERPRAPGRPPRDEAPLSRELVLRAALAVTDRNGLSALSMRAVASSLGVTPMALYHHVAGKEGLLDLVNEAVWLDVRWPVSRGSARWAAHAKATARAIRRALRAHPNAVGLVAARPARAPAVLVAFDGLLGSFTRAGFNSRDALFAADTLGIFTVGHAQAEFGTSPSAAPERQREDLANSRESLERAGLTHVAAVAQGRHDYDAEFEFGLEALVAGLTARRRPRGSTRPAR